MSVSCQLCGESTAKAAAGEWVRCGACGAMVFGPSTGATVLIAHESEEVSAQLGAVAASLGLSALRAAQGREAASIVERHQPPAAVLDVGLMELSTFQLIDQIRRSESHGAMKIILIASIFSRTSYKRRPRSLYGADDYVEQHHIFDMLPDKLAALLSLSFDQPIESVDERVARIEGAVQRRELAGAERIEALAQAIVADIALYNEHEVSAAARGQSIPALVAHLDEGRQMLLDMAPELAQLGGDPVGDAFAALLASRGPAR